MQDILGGAADLEMVHLSHNAVYDGNDFRECRRPTSAFHALELLLVGAVSSKLARNQSGSPSDDTTEPMSSTENRISLVEKHLKCATTLDDDLTIFLFFFGLDREKLHTLGLKDLTKMVQDFWQEQAVVSPAQAHDLLVLQVLGQVAGTFVWIEGGGEDLFQLALEVGVEDTSFQKVVDLHTNSNKDKKA